MSFFETFTESLKQKWLEYFQANRSWISLQMKVVAVKTPDGGSRPPALFILGVVNVLEPKLSNLMLPFYQLNSDSEVLIGVLGLNFDPSLEIGKRSEAAIKTKDTEIIAMLPDS